MVTLERALEIEQETFAGLLDLLPGADGPCVLSLFADPGDKLMALELLNEELGASCERQLELWAALLGKS
jgi:hypothetical protein